MSVWLQPPDTAAASRQWWAGHGLWPALQGGHPYIQLLEQAYVYSVQIDAFELAFKTKV